MKQLPNDLAGFGRYYSWFRSGIAGQLLLCAAEAGIFTSLKEGKTAARLAGELSLHEPTLRGLLDILAVLDLLEKKGDVYQDTPESAELLAEDAYANILSLLGEVRMGLLEPLREFPRFLREGPPAPEQGQSMSTLPEEAWAASSHGGASWALRGAGAQLAGELAALPGAERFTRMLDLGGGHGVFSLYAAQRLPDLRVQVFDSAAVLAVAREYIEAYGMEDRVGTLPGDYLKDSLPGGYDLVLAGSTLNITLAEHATERVVRKIYDALKPGGYFVSLHDSWPEQPEPFPSFPVEYPVYSLLTGLQVNMPRGFIAQTALECGFRSVHSKELCLNAGVLALDIARKP